MQPSGLGPVPHETRRREHRRRRFRRSLLIVPLAMVLLAAAHAALLSGLGWTDRGTKTTLEIALYVEMDESSNPRAVDPFPDSLLEDFPLEYERLDLSKTVVLLRYKAIAQVPRLTPDRIEAYRTVVTLSSEPPLHTLKFDGPSGPRPLDPGQIATLETQIVDLLSERRFTLVHFNRRLPLMFGTHATRSAVPLNPAANARFGLWGLMALPLILIGTELRLRAGERRVRSGRCAWCGHPITSGLCTECGTTYPPPHTATM